MPAVLPWTLEYAGLRQSLAAWRLADPQLDLNNQARDVLSLIEPGAAYDSTPRFAYLGEVILRYGDTIRFRGRRVMIDVAGGASGEDVSYQFAGPWDYLEKITFHQRWRDFLATGDGYTETSHVIVPARFDSSNIIEVITTGQMITEVINFVNAAAGTPVLQVGTIVPQLEIPITEKVDMKCSEVIRLMLGLSPDAVTYIDYSTTPPTFHVLQRAQLTALTLRLSDEKISTVRLRRRDDMVPSAVVINYERRDTVDGATRPVNFRDAYPVEAVGTEYNALTQTVKLYGSEVTTVQGYVETAAIPETPDEQWFIDHGLIKNEDMTISLFEFIGREGGLAREIVDGLVQPWMIADNGDPAETFKDTFACRYSLTVTGRRSETFKPGKVTLNTTNLATGTYSAVASSVAAEATPVGLAAYIYASLSVAPYEGTLELTEQEALGGIGLFNTINISGGTNAYAAMNALVQNIRIDLESGRTQVSLGPPKHLGLNDLLEILRFNRTRRVYTNLSTQQSGTGGANEVTLDGAGPAQNTVSGVGYPESFYFGGTAGTQAAPDGIKIATVPASGATPASTAISVLKSDRDAIRPTAIIKLREMSYSEIQTDGSCLTRKVIVLASEIY